MGAVARADFAKHRLGMNLHRWFTNIKTSDNFLVGQTVTQALQNLALALCQDISKGNGRILLNGGAHALRRHIFLSGGPSIGLLSPKNTLLLLNDLYPFHLLIRKI